jgi:hypothetical protein
MYFVQPNRTTITASVTRQVRFAGRSTMQATQNYGLILFSGTTWREFRDAEATVTGFYEQRWKTVHVTRDVKRRRVASESTTNASEAAKDTQTITEVSPNSTKHL